MRIRLYALAVASIAVLASPASLPAQDAPPAASQPVSPAKAEMNALVKLLEDNAAAWIADKPVEAKADDKIKALSYDETLLPLLSEALEAERKDPVNLYVANKLIAPLLRAKAEVVLAAIPSVKKFESSAGDYKQFPRLDSAELNALQAPAGADDDTVAKAKKLRDDKVARERLILLHNQQLSVFQLTLAKLMFLANDRTMDQALMAYLKGFVQAGVQVYVDILDFISSQAVVMDKDRAKFFFDALSALGKDNRLAKKPLADPAAAKLFEIKPDANTTVPSRTDYVGIRLIEAADIFASLAEMEVVKPPTQDEVDNAGKPAPTSAPAATPKVTPAPTAAPTPTPGPRPTRRPPRGPRPPTGG